MKHHGHLCLKRTLLWSTSPAIRLLDLGPIVKSKHKSLLATTVQYRDSKGAKRFKGSKALKSTQCLNWNLKWQTQMLSIMNDDPQIVKQTFRTWPKDVIYHSLGLPQLFWNVLLYIFSSYYKMYIYIILYYIMETYPFLLVPWCPRPIHSFILP